MAEAKAQRKLTTILAADVVGYSKMMATDEEATLSTLRTFRQVTDALVEKHNGRIFSTAGDAFLAEFPSAVEAVRCAISIQEDLAVRNGQLPEDGQMWFRIGVNVGDVMMEDGDLFGDGVNVAARLEGLAETGGICISGTTFEQVKNKLSIAFDDIGAQQVKNIPEPIPAFRLVPGKVSVAAPGAQAAVPAKAGKRMGVFIAGAAAAIAVLAAAAYFIWLPSAAHPYDGDWQVTVDSLSGCNDNSPKTYSIRIVESKINEPQHRLPKTGSVTRDGELTIKVSDRDGMARNTQVIRIAGDTGSGSFTGRKSGCLGRVEIHRLD